VGFTLFKLFGWQSALPHHIFFHCVHIVNSFMVYLLVRGLVRSRTAATLAMLFFAVFPFRSQAVYWFSGGITAVTFTFLTLVSLLALLRFVREGRWRWWGLSFAFFLLAFFASEVILPLLAIFVLAPWLGPDRPRAKRARQVALGLVPFLGVGLAYIPVKLFVLPKSSYLAIGDKLNWLNLALNVNDLFGLGAIYKLRRGLVDLQNTPMLGLLFAAIGAALGAALIVVVRRRPAPPSEPQARVWPCAAKLGALGVLFILCNYCVFVLADRLYIGRITIRPGHARSLPTTSTPFRMVTWLCSKASRESLARAPRRSTASEPWRSPSTPGSARKSRHRSPPCPSWMASRCSTPCTPSSRSTRSTTSVSSPRTTACPCCAREFVFTAKNKEWLRWS
jgi:hypothetical protein